MSITTKIKGFFTTKLVEDWREGWRWYSNWAFATIGALQGSVMAFVTEKQLAATILFYPTWTWGELAQSIIAFLAVTGFIGRMVKQPAKKTDEPDVVLE